MNATKRFLIILASVAIAGWILGNLLWGPPGYSSEYTERNKAAHEHYIEVSKSVAYKRYVQRPHLNGPDSAGAPPTLARNIQFVEEYEKHPDFQAEQRRQEHYGLFFDLFNGGLVVVLAWRFLSGPIAKFLEGATGELKERMETAAALQASGAARLTQAQAQLASLTEEAKKIDAETEERIRRELVGLAETNASSVEIMMRELEDRKRQELLAVEQRLRRSLVRQAIRQVADECAARITSDRQTGLIEELVQELEQRA